MDRWCCCCGGGGVSFRTFSFHFSPGIIHFSLPSYTGPQCVYCCSNNDWNYNNDIIYSVGFSVCIFVVYLFCLFHIESPHACICFICFLCESKEMESQLQIQKHLYCIYIDADQCSQNQNERFINECLSLKRIHRHQHNVYIHSHTNKQSSITFECIRFLYTVFFCLTSSSRFWLWLFRSSNSFNFFYYSCLLLLLCLTKFEICLFLSFLLTEFMRNASALKLHLHTSHKYLFSK